MQARTIGVATVLTLSVLSGASVWAQERSTSPVFPSDVEMVTVDAVVVDGQGNPVSGLTRDDFVVKEDGKAQPISSFETFVIDASSTSAAAEPGAPQAASRSFAIVLDDLGLSPRDMKDARKGLASFLEKSLRDGDQVTLASTGGGIWKTARLPKGRDELLALMGTTRGRDDEVLTVLDPMSDYEAFAIVDREDHAGGRVTARVADRWRRSGFCAGTLGCSAMIQSRAMALNAGRRERTKATLGVLRRVTEALAPARGRKSLLLVSKGFIEDRTLPLRELEAVSREANAAIYFLDARGLSALQGSGQPSASDLGGAPDPNEVSAIGFESRVLDSAGAQNLALDTGGFTVRNTNDLSRAAARIAEESRVFYLLGFYPPPDKKPGQWRKLRVEVSRKGLTVRARRGYTLRAKDETAPKKARVAVARLSEN